ncbi:MAG: hypothetical protein IT479_14330 [Xanthomonadales bacterium]|nr:hypothetical protein [Xanthomonadales bacterium]MCC6594439.1 hypothetical protein [Xanthomonadales bacterium]
MLAQQGECREYRQPPQYAPGEQMRERAPHRRSRVRAQHGRDAYVDQAVAITGSSGRGSVLRQRFWMPARQRQTCHRGEKHDGRERYSESMDGQECRRQSNDESGEVSDER